MDTKEYNGYTNYETWLVALWIDNEEPSYRYWRETADQIWAGLTEHPPKANGRSSQARIDLAGQLEQEIKPSVEEQLPENGLAADLLGAALSEVDWFDIADNWLSDMSGYARRETYT